MENRDKEIKKKEFAGRLNWALDVVGFLSGRGRQSELGRQFGTSQRGAGKWLSGETIPETTMLAEICIRFGINMDWLLTNRGEMLTDKKPGETDPSGQLNAIVGSVRPIRKAPVVGAIYKNSQGQMALRECDLGTLDVHSNDPEVVCYLEDSDEFAPRFFAGEILVVERSRPPVQFHQVVLMNAAGTPFVMEYLGKDQRYYHLRDVNHKESDTRIEISKVTIVGPIASTFHLSRALEASEYPKLPYTPPVSTNGETEILPSE